MRIQHNIMAMNAYRNYNNNTSALSKNLEKLASGYKINRAGDDAAGLAISEKMRAQITGLNAASKNVKDGISLVKTAEGAMQEIQDMLNRMDYLATQSANGTYDNEVDRANLQKEVDALKSEINRIADSANFNGIKLLDGSLDANRASAGASAISEITTNEYSAQGASPAFKTTFIQDRPGAAISQTNAAFSVNLDDVALQGFTAGDTITLNVGDAQITYTVTGTDSISTAADIVDKLITAGKAVNTASAGESANGATSSPSTGVKTDTASWDAAISTGAGAYVKIDGHYYKMEDGGDSINFTQVDFMGNDAKIVDPSFTVGLKVNGNSLANKTGDTNWQAQMTTVGEGVGSSHQARTEVAIDFSQLKDGDKLVVGNKTYAFKMTANGAGATTREVEIDLSTILKDPEDYSNADKLAMALSKIDNTIGNSTTGSGALWSVGKEPIEGSVGTLTFQSMSSYKDETAGNTIGGAANGDLCSMKGEANVMAQFSGIRAEQAASASFTLDVTKLKVGDTITVDGVTFEFTDGEGVATKGNVEVDLKKYGIEGQIASYQTGNVLEDLKTAINTELANRFDFQIDGNKMTLVSKDIAATTAKEDRVAAKIELAGSAVNGKGLMLQIGDTSDDFNQLAVGVKDMHTSALGIADLKISDPESAKAAIQTIKDAINSVSSTRGDLGAVQNRLEHTANNLSVMTENIQDAESTIRDTDIAEEMMSYTKNNILIQSAQAMLAQANAVPQGVLQLLG